MRIWDLHPQMLCRNHLLGEHHELHSLWSILTQNRNIYRHHPETKRWEGKLAALYKRHELLKNEMRRRGYNHKSELEKRHANGISIQRKYVHTKPQQIEILRKKGCGCNI